MLKGAAAEEGTIITWSLMLEEAVTATRTEAGTQTGEEKDAAGAVAATETETKVEGDVPEAGVRDPIGMEVVIGIERKNGTRVDETETDGTEPAPRYFGFDFA